MLLETCWNVSLPGVLRDPAGVLGQSGSQKFDGYSSSIWSEFALLNLCSISVSDLFFFWEPSSYLYTNGQTCSAQKGNASPTIVIGAPHHHIFCYAVLHSKLDAFFFCFSTFLASLQSILLCVATLARRIPLPAVWRRFFFAGAIGRAVTISKEVSEISFMYRGLCTQLPPLTFLTTAASNADSLVLSSKRNPLRICHFFSLRHPTSWIFNLT